MDPVHLLLRFDIPSMEEESGRGRGVHAELRADTFGGLGSTNLCMPLALRT